MLEAAVVPEADPEGLLKPKAFVVLRADAKTDGLHEALQEYVKQKIGVWKYPRWIDDSSSPCRKPRPEKSSGLNCAVVIANDVRHSGTRVGANDGTTKDDVFMD